MSDPKKLSRYDTMVIDGKELKILEFAEEPHTGLAVVSYNNFVFSVPTAWLETLRGQDRLIIEAAKLLADGGKKPKARATGHDARVVGWLDANGFDIVTGLKVPARAESEISDYSDDEITPLEKPPTGVQSLREVLSGGGSTLQPPNYDAPPCQCEESCKASSGIHEGITRGKGGLDDNGFWEFPCPGTKVGESE